MGFMGSMMGNSSGSGFQAQGVNQEQLDTSYNQTQSGIKQQQQFVDALQGQNGLQNQSNVFGQQQGLANQLQGVANGTGPNPAQAALNQATSQNVSNQNAMMAGQRGASQNVGLMARQAAMQGANTQQQAAGQGATMQAQQQLSGMQQLGAQQANMGNMANSQVNQQQAALTALNQQQLQQQANLMGLQANINSANAGIAGGNQGAQQNILGQGMGAIGSIGNMFGGGSGASSAGGGLMAGGGDSIMGGAGDMGEMLAAKGGMVPKMAEGGMPDTQMTDLDSQAPTVAIADAPVINGPQSKVGQMFNNYTATTAAAPKAASGPKMPDIGSTIKQGGDLISSIGKNKFIQNIGEMIGGAGGAVGTMAGGAADAVVGGAGADALGEIGAGALTAAPAVAVAAKGGKVPALVSAGEKYLDPKDVKDVEKGKKSAIKAGETIPGKPKVSGAKNSYANDTIKKDLDEGGIVLPRSITQAKDPAKAAHAFVSAIMAKQGKSLPKRGK